MERILNLDQLYKIVKNAIIREIEGIKTLNLVYEFSEKSALLDFYYKNYLKESFDIINSLIKGFNVLMRNERLTRDKDYHLSIYS